LPEAACLFCAVAAGEVRAEVVAADAEAVAFLDHRPVFKGHTLVVPRRHVETLPDLPADLGAALLGLVQRLCRAMVAGLGADGTWVSVNNVVSQSVPHVHVHVVPRRRRDGLRGFYWPRTKYEDAGEMAEYGRRLRAALEPSGAP
jgi:histidine triad (HIT) family protein